MSSNQGTFGSTCEKKVWSMMKPSRATRMPGRSARPSDQVPGRGRAGDAGRDPAVAGVVEGERLAVLHERVRPHRPGRLLAPVDRGDLPLRGADDHEPASADAARERLGHAEDAGGRD